MSYNQGKLDGFPVELYDGRFSGTFELEDDDGESIGYDDTVTFLVVASAGKAAFSTMKNGELKRTNTFSILSSTIVPVDTAAKWFHELNEESDDEPTLFTPSDVWEDRDFYEDDEYEERILPEREVMGTRTGPDGTTEPFYDDDPIMDYVERRSAPDDDLVVVSRGLIPSPDPTLAAFLNED